ncbi:hypothetical protein OIU84_014162 [Salix udensis]|uniref:Uncharacterized protein n=1 Tax=Salix udensis TaxID=889485 RepID=A0AAD6JCB8_9ROSI|nr:hypothetical protein OIU84_014162 [Salix udensis]
MLPCIHGEKEQGANPYENLPHDATILESRTLALLRPPQIRLSASDDARYGSVIVKQWKKNLSRHMNKHYRNGNKNKTLHGNIANRTAWSRLGIRWAHFKSRARWQNLTRQNVK